MISAWNATGRTAVSRLRFLRAMMRGSVAPAPAPREKEGLLERGASLAGLGAWECDLDTNALTWTDGVFDLFGLPRGAKIRREDVVALYSEESREEMERLRAEAIERQQSFTMDARILRPDGEYRWMRLTGGVAQDHGRLTHLYGLKQDVTREREKLEALRKIAEHDALTGLASRSMFQSRFLNASAAARAVFPVAALVLFDVDGFKQINDESGHAAGDACLDAVARRLTACFPDAAMIARIGGDEFAILSPAPAEHLSQRVAACLLRLTDPILWKGRLLRVSASAGMAASDDPVSYDPDRMFSAADAALYEAKRAGRNRMRLAAA